jgi:hypothetical protein
MVGPNASQEVKRMASAQRSISQRKKGKRKGTLFHFSCSSQFFPVGYNDLWIPNLC